MISSGIASPWTHTLACLTNAANGSARRDTMLSILVNLSARRSPLLDTHASQVHVTVEYSQFGFNNFSTLISNECMICVDNHDLLEALFFFFVGRPRPRLAQVDPTCGQRVAERHPSVHTRLVSHRFWWWKLTVTYFSCRAHRQQ